MNRGDGGESATHAARPLEWGEPEAPGGFAPPPPAAAGSREDARDEEHLRLLALGYYVMAGLSALFALLPILHVAMGIAMVTGSFPAGRGSPPPDFMGWVFVGIGGTIIIVGEALALLTLLAGVKIAQRRSRDFVLVIAALLCLNTPLGTLLGVFTFLALTRESIAARFT